MRKITIDKASRPDPPSHTTADEAPVRRQADPPRPAHQVGQALWRAFKRHDSAQATLEFILAFPIILVFVMAIFNFSGLSIANQMAQYAAFSAARIAIVNPDEKEKMAFINMIPLSPSGTDIIPGLTNDIPIIGELEKLLEEICGVQHGLRRALFAYPTTYFNITFHDQQGREINDQGKSRKDLLEKSAYVRASTSYLYFPPFPSLNELTQYLAQRNEIYIIGGRPVHRHDPVKGMKSYIFFGDQLVKGPNIYKTAWAIDQVVKGTPVLPIYQETLLGIN